MNLSGFQIVFWTRRSTIGPYFGRKTFESRVHLYSDDGTVCGKKVPWRDKFAKVTTGPIKDWTGPLRCGLCLQILEKSE